MQDLPIGISEFVELRQTNCIYVDKTKFVYSLLTKNRRAFLSRPRRFGKSLLVSTLEAALEGKKEFFEGLWIANSDYHWKPFGVIRMDFSQLNIQSSGEFKRSLTHSLQRIAKQHAIHLDPGLDMNSTFIELIFALSESFESVAILIDEYDSPILNTLHKTELSIEIRDVLKNFSNVIKGQASRVKFVFVTGVSAFSKSGLSSGLNNLKNLTMNKLFFDICGYTEKEIEPYFKDHIQLWANEQNISYEELKKSLKNWYNGYCFKENTSTIYNPFSLTCAIDIKELKNFWFESATPKVLLDELQKKKRHEEYKILELDKLQNTEELLQTFEIEYLPLPALLFQMGYLTISSYDPLTKNYQLTYPNLEVKSSFHRHLAALFIEKPLEIIDPLIGKIYRALSQENIEEMVSILTTIFSGIPYSLHIEDERFYHALLQTVFSAAGVDTQSERMTSIGRMDLLLKLPCIIYIIELKINNSPDIGLKQIEMQKYYEPFLLENLPIRAVALSFIRKKASSKEHSQFSISYETKKIKK